MIEICDWVGERLALPNSRTNPDLDAARFLLKPGRKYEQVVKGLEPYHCIREERPEERSLSLSDYVAGHPLVRCAPAAEFSGKSMLFS